MVQTIPLRDKWNERERQREQDIFIPLKSETFLLGDFGIFPTGDGETMSVFLQEQNVIMRTIFP